METIVGFLKVGSPLETRYFISTIKKGGMGSVAKLGVGRNVDCGIY